MMSLPDRVETVNHKAGFSPRSWMSTGEKRQPAPRVLGGTDPEGGRRITGPCAQGPCRRSVHPRHDAGRPVVGTRPRPGRWSRRTPRSRSPPPNSRTMAGLARAARTTWTPTAPPVRRPLTRAVLSRRQGRPRRHSGSPRRGAKSPARSGRTGTYAPPEEAPDLKPTRSGALLAPPVGLEPTTLRLTAECSAS